MIMIIIGDQRCCAVRPLVAGAGPSGGALGGGAA